jgi:hypothetical protein
MEILIIVIVIGIMLAAILLSGKRISKEEYSGPQRKDLNVSQEKKANFFKEEFRPEYRQGKEFKIAGINNVPPFQTFGDFEGYVKPDVNNKYDEYAISIHSKYNDELVGYLPRSGNNKKLFETMLKEDAALYASGYISDFTDEQGATRLYGRIYLDIQ